MVTKKKHELEIIFKDATILAFGIEIPVDDDFESIDIYMVDWDDDLSQYFADYYRPDEIEKIIQSSWWIRDVFTENENSFTLDLSHMSITELISKIEKEL